MTLDFEGLMRILANSLYSEKKVFIRELVQNGHDSVRRRENKDENHRGRIDIETHPDEGMISFTDNGIGMNADDLRDYLSRIGGSGTREVGRDQEQVTGLVGQFGIGFLSGFIVADRLEVRTRKVGEDQGWLWKNGGGKSYTLEPCSVAQPGTAVTVFIKDITDRTIIHVDSVQSVIREYADMLLVPIHVNHGTAPVNTMRMPWERGDISDEERELDCQLYLHRTIRGDSVMETIPVVLTGQVQAGGILYISRMRTWGVRVPRNLRIHQQRMFVANDAQLLPEWAEFVSGIIDASTLTPNAARDGFIRNAQWRDLQEALGRLVIAHLEKLHDRDREKLSFILKWHDLGIKAACYYHDDFFAKFANLLEWRVNRGNAPASADDLEDERNFAGGGLAFHWRTLPEVLAAIPATVGNIKKLLCFTTSSSANQYFDMANAKQVTVVDASRLYEDKLIAAYVKLQNTPPLEVVYVDRGGSSGLFDSLQSGDDAVRRLAEVMSQVIHPGGADFKVDAKRFAPATLPAVLWNPEATKGQMSAREILDDPSSPSSVRAMAEELMRSSLNKGMRMTINAACPFIARLSQQDFRDPEITHIMLGVYNSAILYNAELLTPRNAKIFHDQFGTLLERTVEHLAERQQLQKERASIEAERRAMAPPQENVDADSRHRIFFLMTPFKSYDGLEEALREVIEDRWGCQLFLARDRAYHSELRGNVDAHLAQADAFLAEVSTGNPNVMFELGAARSHFRHRPTVLLAHPAPDKNAVELPADLSGLLRVEYSKDATVSTLIDYLDSEFHKNHAVAALIDDSKREHFVSARRLIAAAAKFNGPTALFSRLAERIPTEERWEKAKPADLTPALTEYGCDADDADFLLKQIRKGIR